MLLISDISTKGAAVCTVLIFWSVDRSLGYRIIANCLSGHLVNNFLKLTACVYRPWIREHKLIPAPQAVESATGYSFPSGHTQMAMSFYGSIAVHFRSGNPLVCVLCTVMILLTGFSRNYLGVHTPQDVFVSIMIGLILLFISLTELSAEVRISIPNRQASWLKIIISLRLLKSSRTQWHLQADSLSQ